MSRRKLEPYLLLLPSTIFLLVFFAWPMFRAIGLAFQTDDGQWTLAHVERMVNDVAFRQALRNTFLLIVSVIPLQFVLALVMALLVTAGLRGSSLLIYFYALPIAVSDLAAGIVWLSIFTENGYLNTILTGLGLLERPFIFLNIRTSWPLIAVIIAEVWRATSIVFVILVAGLQGIPKEYDEAAEVFGAGYFTRLRRVTLPLLRPSIQVALILRTILAFQVFAVVVALTGGGMPVLALEAFDWYANLRNPHVAAAYATLILLVSLGIAVIYLRALRVQSGVAR
ncbi:MAG: sugar ABC transporter permease [Chloroflexi bacterium]|nr:sugar ABC transporter permease [Chloroflexota bacterium]MCI0580452.1 sugar ABC transporter permease [Chloroflexota bacterium]MCI0649196.1 sugar ABC transporter permease [Chloroflexota bacterium]MCI0727992.1 sugar ABC transporter permease [Chloroflexota bacterium]